MDAHALPGTGRLDSTTAFLEHGYGFIRREAERLGTPAFETRLLGRRTACLVGPALAERFYTAPGLIRSGALPGRVQRTLVGRGSIQTLDGDDHRARKALFVDLLSPTGVGDLEAVAAEEWSRAIDQWSDQPQVVLLDEVALLLLRAACQWTGLPLSAEEEVRRRDDLLAMIDAPAAVGPRYWLGRLGRRRSERWIEGLVREERRAASGSPLLARLAEFREPSGRPLDDRVAAVEVLNVIRPLVAVNRFVAFATHALVHHEAAAEWLRAGGEQERLAFVQEVRRHYPFFPAAAGVAAQDVELPQGRIRRGSRVLLDLYGTNRDPERWDDPDEFRPQRFVDELPTPYDLVPQGGGDPERGHRCPGELATVRLMVQAVEVLTTWTTWTAPAQDDTIPLWRIPARPLSGMVLAGLRARAPEAQPARAPGAPDR
jgi:fatty-acid peroxygenase